MREQVIHLGRDDAAAPGGTDSLAAGKPGHAGTARNADAADLPDSPQRPPPAPAGLASPPASTRSSPPPAPTAEATCAILTFITAAEPVDAILTHLGLPITASPLSPARGPPRHDFAFHPDPGFDLDQTPAGDPAEPELVPDFDFDQSTGA